MHKWIYLAILGIFAVSCVVANDSPQQITQGDSIYFLMTDRFADGDTTNNDFGNGEYDPSDLFKNHGGDFQGVINQLDYIKEMGFTAIWITPVVENTSKVLEGRISAYHGYWTHDFSKIDRHLGSKEKLKELVDEAHKRNIDVIIDIVANHLSPGPLNPSYQYPFFSSPDFHHFGGIENLPGGYNNPWAVENGDIAGLQDFDTASVYVQDTIAKQHASYLNYIGADGIRMDTVKHVPKEDWVQIMSKLRAQLTNPKKKFSIGEAYFNSGSQEHIHGACGWYTIPNEDKTYALDSVLNFGLFAAINYQLFQNGASVLSDVHHNQFDRGKYGNPYNLGNFVDNHDVPLFLGTHQNNWDQFRTALTLIFTWPGMPIVYSGSEQGQNDGGKGDPVNRQNLWGLGYNKQHPLYQHIKNLNRVRNANNRAGKAIKYGKIQEVWSGGHLYAFERIDGDNRALIIINSSGRWETITNLKTSIGSGTHQELVYGEKRLEVGANGLVSAHELAPYEIIVFSND